LQGVPSGRELHGSPSGSHVFMSTLNPFCLQAAPRSLARPLAPSWLNLGFGLRTLELPCFSRLSLPSCAIRFSLALLSPLHPPPSFRAFTNASQLAVLVCPSFLPSTVHPCSASACHSHSPRVFVNSALVVASCCSPVLSFFASLVRLSPF